MGFVAAAAASVYPSTYMELRWVKRRGKSKSELNLKPSMIPIYISTNPSDINPQGLSKLFINCNHSSNRFPILDSKNKTVADAVDFDKLCLALSHSFVIVSVFANLPALSDDQSSKQLLENLVQRVVPVTPSNGQLVGFGRAVSDVGLTASIHDVMVIPSLRRMGIGRMIVQRILRMLTSREIYDIAALCSEQERLFFEACGFGNDILGSTTMMYAKTASTDFGGNEGGIVLIDHSNNVPLPTQGAPERNYLTQQPLGSVHRPENHSQSNFPYNHSMPYSTNYSNLSGGGPSYAPAAGPTYQPLRAPPPPPPPPSNVGYIPTFIPRMGNLPSTYVNMPSSGPPARGMRPGFGVGLGAGALAAGAVIFGDDFMSGFDVPAGLQDASLTISTDPPF